MKITKPIPKIVLEFDELFMKTLDGKEQFSDWKNFRNSLIRFANNVNNERGKND